MQASKAWKKQHNELTWSKKKATLEVLRKKEKEDEQAAGKLREKRRVDRENAANSRARAPLPFPERATLGKARRGEESHAGAKRRDFVAKWAQSQVEAAGCRALDIVTAWHVEVPEAEEPTGLLGPAAATLEPKHRLKERKRWEASINELFVVPEARATGATVLSVRTPRQRVLLCRKRKSRPQRTPTSRRTCRGDGGAGQSHGK
ncbi:RH16 [Symbiodinium sp. CCMP2592]|nr:RH16 [Symbiodinium sp. CCMP2592]